MSAGGGVLVVVALTTTTRRPHTGETTRDVTFLPGYRRSTIRWKGLDHAVEG
jgi:hypothetical protein